MWIKVRQNVPARNYPPDLAGEQTRVLRRQHAGQEKCPWRLMLLSRRNQHVKSKAVKREFGCCWLLELLVIPGCR